MAISIRWRLSLWNTLALAVVLLGFSALVYFLLARSLYQRIDWLLLHEWRELEHDPGMTGDVSERLAYWIEELQEHEKILCVAIDSEGRIVARPESLAAESVPAVAPVNADELQFENLIVPGLARQRTLAGRVRLGDKDYRILLMASREDADKELSRLLTVLVTAVPI